MLIVRDRRGQAMAEMALVMPFLVVLTLGIMTFGIAINSKIVVSGAAREAAREYAVYQDAGKMRQRAEEFLVGGITASREDILSNYTISHRVSGEYVTVTVTYAQPVFVPGMMLLVGGPKMDNRMPLTASATFKIEATP